MALVRRGNKELENMVNDLIVDAFRNGMIRCTDGTIDFSGTSRNISITLNERELARIIQEVTAVQRQAPDVIDNRFS